MTTHEHPAWIRVHTVGPCSWDDLWAEAWSIAGWSGTAALVRYEESPVACTLEAALAQDVAPRPGAFEGRLFGGQAELRWIAAGEGLHRGWILVEAAEKPADGGASPPWSWVTWRERRYILNGLYDPELGAFREDRFPGKLFRYPLPSGQVPDDRARAHVVVREYRRAEPDWLNVADPDVALAGDLLLAHRFVAVRTTGSRMRSTPSTSNEGAWHG